jgi:hypothetical protein
MYRFSRSIYKELAPLVIDEPDGGFEARRQVLDSCEGTMRRLAFDRRYFAKPARTLFNEVRVHFPISKQHYVYRVIDTNVTLAKDFLEKLPPEVALDGVPRQCHASTRKGKPCQREPLPGREYCPSHKHLEEPIDETFEELLVAEREPVAA